MATTMRSITAFNTRPSPRKPLGVDVLLLLAQLAFVAVTISPMWGQPHQKTLRKPVRSIPVVSSEARRTILDLAFPRNETLQRGELAKLVLRFLPSFHPESQLTITVRQNDEVHLEVLLSTAQLDRVLDETANDSNVEIPRVVAHMGITRRSRLLSAAEFQQWHRGFWLALNDSTMPLMERAAKHLVQLDGTRYLLQYVDGITSLSFDVLDSEVGQDSGNDLPLVRWMNQIRVKALDSTKTQAGRAVIPPATSGASLRRRTDQSPR